MPDSEDTGLMPLPFYHMGNFYYCQLFNIVSDSENLPGYDEEIFL